MSVSNLSTGLRPGVCTSTTRPVVPYEGQMIYETDTDLTFIWGGSAWQQVSGGTAVGNSGLVFVKQQTVGSGVSSVIVTNAFNATYDNYLIYLNAVGCSVTNDSFMVQLRTGTTTSTASYYFSLIYNVYTGGINQAAQSNGSSWNNVGRGISANDACSFSFNLNAPFLSVKTTMTGTATGSDLTGANSGYHNVASSYDQFVVSLNSGTMTGGSITVYGYRKG
jgi:hypothetical protein